MRRKKLKNFGSGLLAPLLIIVAVALSILIPEAKALLVVNGSYPAVVCPGVFAGGREVISLPNKKLSTRVILGTGIKLKVQNTMKINGASAPTLVSGNPGSEIAFLSSSESTKSAAVCEVGGSDQWFIGGSGGVTSQGTLQIINSWLSDSTVQIFPYNSKISLAPISVTVKANSGKSFALASIAPGDESVAFHVVALAGRVSSFLLDHRKNGLHDLGSSFVAPVSAPAAISYIAGLYGSSTKAASVMRFLVPGNVNATVHLTIYSEGGAFTPFGFDSLSVARQRVVDVPLPALSLTSPFGIGIKSDQPLFAATLTRTTAGGADFSWANQLRMFSSFRVNFVDAKVQFFFIGKSLALRAQWNDAKGQAQSALIRGDSSALWSPSGVLSSITFRPLSKSPIFGGALVSKGVGGYSNLPLLSNVLASRAQAPIADLRTLTRH